MMVEELSGLDGTFAPWQEDQSVGGPMTWLCCGAGV
jgi:hypothetical protein